MWKLSFLPAFALSVVGPLGAQTAAPVTLQGKQVAAPASEILAGHLQLPAADAHPERMRGNWLRMEAADRGYETTLWLPAGEAQIVPLGSDRAAQHWRVRTDERTWTTFGELERKGLARIETLVPSDPWTSLAPERITLRLAQGARLTLAEPRSVGSAPELLVLDASDLELHQHLSSLQRTMGQPLRLQVRLVGFERAVRTLSADVLLESGSGRTKLALQPDGRGHWSAALPQDLLGEVVARTQVVVLTAAGETVQRSGVLAFEIDPVAVEWAGGVSVAPAEPGITRLRLPIAFTGPTEKVHLAAEVWATDAQGAWAPACWLARQCPIDANQAVQELSLDFDHRWLQREGLQAPLQLRNVRLQDPNGWMLWFQDAEEAVLGAPAQMPALGNGDLLVRPTQTNFAVAGTSGGPIANDSTLQPLFGLMLIHGWCSGGGVWAPAQFDGPLLIHHDPSANRSYDEFAQRLGTLGAQRRSFGAIGHSQGGNAALHLLTYYVSGLDNAVGPRRIQSLASPYQGTPLASLGFILCGNNSDMTPGGSAAWLANIPMAQRSEVYYYTTSNSGSACQFLTNAFLTNPEDGTVEQFRGQLPGANNMGHVTGWCHTTGMSDPAGYTDTARNAVMNANAAR